MSDQHDAWSVLIARTDQSGKKTLLKNLYPVSKEINRVVRTEVSHLVIPGNQQVARALKRFPNATHVTVNNDLSRNALKAIKTSEACRELVVEGHQSGHRKHGKTRARLPVSSSVKSVTLVNCTGLTELPNVEKLILIGPLEAYDNLLAKADQCRTLVLANNPTASCLPPHLPPNLASLEVRGWPCLVNMPNWASATLRDLKVQHCSSLTQPPRLEQLGGLQSLTIHDCRSLAQAPDLSSAPFLESLELSACPSVRQIEGLTRLSELRHLNLSDCTGLEQVPSLSGLTGIKTLDLSGLNMHELPPLPKGLIALNLNRCRQLSVTSSLIGLVNLRDLKLSECSVLERVAGLDGLSALETLDLSNLTRLSVIERLPANLVELDLQKCPLLQQGPNLASMARLAKLNLGGSPSAARALLPTMQLDTQASWAPRLNALRLGWFGRAVATPREQGALRLPQRLFHLDLSECELQQLPDLSACSHLRKLFVRGCPDLKQLNPLPAGLEKLAVGGCSALTHIPMTAKLRELELSFCNQIKTLRGLPKTLQTLDIQHCMGLERLDALPQGLRSINLSECERLQEVTTWPESLEHIDARGCFQLRTEPPFQGLRP